MTPTRSSASFSSDPAAAAGRVPGVRVTVVGARLALAPTLAVPETVLTLGAVAGFPTCPLTVDVLPATLGGPMVPAILCLALEVDGVGEVTVDGRAVLAVVPAVEVRDVVGATLARGLTPAVADVVDAPTAFVPDVEADKVDGRGRAAVVEVAVDVEVGVGREVDPARLALALAAVGTGGFVVPDRDEGTEGLDCGVADAAKLARAEGTGGLVVDPRREGVVVVGRVVEFAAEVVVREGTNGTRLVVPAVTRAVGLAVVEEGVGAWVGGVGLGDPAVGSARTSKRA